MPQKWPKMAIVTLKAAILSQLRLLFEGGFYFDLGPLAAASTDDTVCYIFNCID